MIFAKTTFTQSHPRGFAYWERVNEFIQREPVQERDRLFMAMFRALGIEKGTPFQPDSRKKGILVDAAAMGEQMARVTVYEKRFENAYYRKDAKWQYALVVDPSQRQPNYDELDERTDWFYEAIGCSYAMITTTLAPVRSTWRPTRTRMASGWMAARATACTCHRSRSQQDLEARRYRAGELIRL